MPLPESEKGSLESGPRQFIGLFLGGLALMLLGLHPLSAVCFTVLSARFWLTGDRRKAYGVSVLTGVIGATLLASVAVGLFYIAAGLLGCLTGALVERRWPYGWRLAAVAGLAFAGVVVSTVAMWPELRHETTIFMNARIAELEAQPNDNDQWIEIFRWYDLNYAYISIGSIFGSLLFMLAYVLSVVDRWHGLRGGVVQRRLSGFQRMRLPEWLVWIAIVVALMWFADRQWPNELLRMVTWNAAVALTCLYGLHGFSILLYGLTVLKASALVSFAVISGLILFGLIHLLTVVGLFDTWVDFRIRIRRLARFRRAGFRSDDRD